MTFGKTLVYSYTSTGFIRFVLLSRSTAETCGWEFCVYRCFVFSSINLSIIVDFCSFTVLTNIEMEVKLIVRHYSCLVYPEGIFRNVVMY